MHLRRFKGRELPEVVAQVRAELGPQAVILHTKERPRGLLRLVHGREVEVVAAVDAAVEPRAAESSVAAPSVAAPRAVAAPPPRAAAPAPVVDLAPIQAEIAELRRMLLRFGGARGLPSTMAPVFAWLVDVGIDEPLVFRILESVPAADAAGTVEDVLAAVERRVAGMLRIAAPSLTPAAGAIAFVGPAGAGKSTTLAKLAVRAHLEGRTPHVVTFDGLTPGVPAPLEAITRLVGIKHELATTPAEVAAAVARPDALTLIDTPGLGRGDAAAVTEIAALLHAARPTEVHFVMPATMKTEDAVATLAALGALWITRITITKLDEALTYGSILSVAAESGLPLAYTTAGRDVPDDIYPATAAELARRILRRDRP